LTKKNITSASIILLISIGVTLIQYCKPKEKTSNDLNANTNSYVGDQQCKSCHANEYTNWQKSDHFKAIQKADDSSVLGNFKNASFTADGVSTHFFKKEGKFYINTEGDDGKNRDFEVRYAFGYYPLQQYLIEFPDGKLQTTRLSWDSKQKKWFHQYAGQKIDYRNWLHWTKNAQNWNTMCAECHSTNLKKNYDVDKDSYHTSFDVLNVSCEACHGPGKNHISYIGGEDYKKGNKIEHSLLQLAKNNSQTAQINACAPCHALQNGLDPQKTNSEELLDNYVPVLPNTERFHADGQVNEEDYTYASFLQSKMYTRGIKCSNCHDPHSGKLQLIGNLTCLKCHEKTYDSPSHHFHQINTEASLCKNCHAPGKYYMGNDLRHDHSFRVPRPDLSVQYSTPNACNNCHTNKSAKWSSDAVEKWYGSKRKYHYAEDLIPGSKINEKSEYHLLKLMADTSVPNIIKATAVNYLGNISSEKSVNALSTSLNDKDPLIRYTALRSLMYQYRFLANKTIIAPLLNDKVKAVRIAAAELMGFMGEDQIPPEYLSSYSIAKNEFEKNLVYQTDFAHGNIPLADYYARNKNYPLAEKFYKRTLQKDSLANLARLNLAVVYNTQGKNAEAIDILKMAVKTDDKNDQAWYNLALLYNEINDSKNTAAAFEKTLSLKPVNARFFYNYGLFLQQKGNSVKAISILQQGLKQFPADESLNYAMTFIYIQTGHPDKAKTFATVLKSINPNNPDYKQFFVTLGIQ
jgi:tetratricopeptide (TPR) repeat protein